MHDLLSFARSLARHRELLLMLTWRDIRIKYKQTVLGFLWALLMPILIVSAGLVVKLGVAQVSGLSARVSVTGATAGSDRVTVNALAGDDVIDASATAASAPLLTLDGGGSSLEADPDAMRLPA